MVSFVLSFQFSTCTRFCVLALEGKAMHYAMLIWNKRVILFHLWLNFVVNRSICVIWRWFIKLVYVSWVIWVSVVIKWLWQKRKSANTFFLLEWSELWISSWHFCQNFGCNFMSYGRSTWAYLVYCPVVALYWNVKIFILFFWKCL